MAGCQNIFYSNVLLLTLSAIIVSIKNSMGNGNSYRTSGSCPFCDHCNHQIRILHIRKSDKPGMGHNRAVTSLIFCRTCFPRSAVAFSGKFCARAAVDHFCHKVFQRQKEWLILLRPRCHSLLCRYSKAPSVRHR